jgi:hypothetical protein
MEENSKEASQKADDQSDSATKALESMKLEGEPKTRFSDFP